ncbi:hypothetical protein FB451DRAFT_1127570 [Mycena latifolia]|nr:hypothetical protein FB451DRAFT_1127570 [Mycena latifolia]
MVKPPISPPTSEVSGTGIQPPTFDETLEFNPSLMVNPPLLPRITRVSGNGIQPPTFDKNYVPCHYHLKSDSESETASDDAETVDFNPSLMVKSPISPKMPGMPGDGIIFDNKFDPSAVVNTPITPQESAASGDILTLTLLLSEAHPRIFPGSPEDLGRGRYGRKIVVPDEPTRFTIAPLEISFLPDTPPPGWTTCLHPDGAQYFFNEENRVFTDANLFDKAALVFINTIMHKVHDFLRAHGVQLATDVDLVLDEYLYSDQTKGCQYYFVNHKDRCVFWMDNANSDMFSVTHELNGITSASHIRHELEAQYWYHCELFPTSFELTHAIVDELRDILLHSLGDLITSATSTVPWKRDDLIDMINLANGLRKNVGRSVDSRFIIVDNKLSGSNCLVGRFMCLCVRARVYNFHGEPSARLNVDHSVYGTVRKRTLFIAALSPLLFYAPDFHLVGLHKIHTDKLIRHRGWSDFITRLNGEWQEFTLLATVVLNANVAFLSIQSVDQGGFALPERTPAQISSYLSMLTSVGAVIIGLLLVKQHRDRDRMAAADAAKFISDWTYPILGLEALAFLYSLPYAMLIWSMVSFLAAFSFMCFENSNLITRTLVGVIWAAVAALILWCIFSAWESGNWDKLRSLLCWGNTSTAEEQDDSDMVKEEVKSTAQKSRLWERWWAWLSMVLRERPGVYDSERTVMNV